MTPEREAAHPPHHFTGHRWLDLTLAMSAMFVSLVSLVVAVRHGMTMDRLVEANSWPFLMYSTSNVDPQRGRLITLKIANVGVGPARLQTFEVWWDGQPAASADDFLIRCCIRGRKTPLEVDDIRGLNLFVGIAAPNVLRAGDAQDFIGMERTEANADVWDRLDRARVNLKMRACYCSVFDECWLTDLWQTSAKRVRACPAVKTPFTIPERWFKGAPQRAASSD